MNIQAFKHNYIEAIDKLMEETIDIELLDLIYQILKKSKERAAS